MLCDCCDVCMVWRGQNVCVYGDGLMEWSDVCEVACVGDGVGG